MSHSSDVLSGITQDSVLGFVFYLKDTIIFDNCRNQHNIVVNNIIG